MKKSFLSLNLIYKIRIYRKNIFVYIFFEKRSLRKTKGFLRYQN